MFTHLELSVFQFKIYDENIYLVCTTEKIRDYFYRKLRQCKNQGDFNKWLQAINDHPDVLGLTFDLEKYVQGFEEFLHNQNLTA